MRGCLLDTNVVSMLAPPKAQAPDVFLDWLERADREARVYLSVVTIHQIEQGIANLDHKGATAKAAALEDWLSGSLATFDDKILGLDIPAASLSGRLEAQALGSGNDPGMADVMIAGIASAHDLTVVNRNAKHFSIRSCGPDTGGCRLTPSLLKSGQDASESAVALVATRAVWSARPH